MAVGEQDRATGREGPGAVMNSFSRFAREIGHATVLINNRPISFIPVGPISSCLILQTTDRP